MVELALHWQLPSGVSTAATCDNGGLGIVCCGLSSSSDQRSASFLKSKNVG